MPSLDIAASIRALPDELWSTVNRFWLSVCCALVATFAAYHLSYQVDWTVHRALPLLLTASLGISLGFAVRMLAERTAWDRIGLRLAEAGVIALLVIYFVHLPTYFEGAPAAHFQRYALFAIAAHLIVAVLPFWKTGSQEAFWQYNKTLFLRFLTALLYSSVLYMGLSTAVLALNVLFGISFGDGFLLRLWFVIVGLFNTLIFLGGIPHGLSFETQQDYPRGLKIFTVYILLPLVLLYLLILYAYVGKVIIMWDWPRGSVSNLIIWFSGMGILSLLLTYPVQFRSENRWLAAFARLYYAFLIPLVPVLFIAIGLRISEYGMTESRYYGLAVAVWLAFISLFYTITRSRNIKLIPASLLVVTLLLAVGPFSAFPVSRDSQMARLDEILSRNLLLEEGVLRPIESPPTEKEVDEIADIMEYLLVWHGMESLQPFFEDDIRRIVTSEESAYDSSWLRVRRLLIHAGVETSTTTLRLAEISVVGQTRFLTISGYDYLNEFFITDGHDGGLTGQAGRGRYRFEREPPVFWLIAEDDSTAIHLAELFGDAPDDGSEHSQPIDLALGELRARLIIRRGSATVLPSGEYRMGHIQGVLLTTR